MPSTSVVICHQLVVMLLVPCLHPSPGALRGKGHGFLGHHLCQVPVFIFLLGSREFWVSEPGPGHGSLSEGCAIPGPGVVLIILCLFRALVRDHDVMEESPPTPAAAVMGGCRAWGLVQRK